MKKQTSEVVEKKPRKSRVTLAAILSHPAVALIQAQLSPSGQATGEMRVVYTLQFRDGWYIPGLISHFTEVRSYDLSGLASELLAVCTDSDNDVV